MQKTVLLCVTGCIAAYKSCEIARALQKAGMTADFSWGPSAKQYLEVYRRAMG